MYILKNAVVSILRNKGRNILMGIIILVISCSCCITLAIKNSATNLVESYANKYDIEASISMNREALMGDFGKGAENREENINKFNKIGNLTLEEIIAYGESDYVSEFYYTYELGMNSSTLEKATQEIENTETEMMGPNSGGGRGKEIKNNRLSSGDFTITGYSSYESMTDFINGTYQIEEGSVSDDFTASTCVINKELATLNDISVGDSIVLVNPDNTKLKYTLEVTGIYTEKEENNDMTSMFSNSVNTIITNTSVTEKMIVDDSSLNATITPKYVLENKDVIDAFVAELTEKGLSEYYQVTTNLETITSETESIRNVSSFATTFLVVTFIIGAVVLLVLNMINVRERRYEIGVLRTIGMKKMLVISQFVCELLIVSFVALAIGAGIGSILSVPTANKLLENEISLQEEKQEEIGNNFGRPEELGKKQSGHGGSFEFNGIANVTQISSIHAAVDVKTVLEMFGLGILLTLISSLAAMVSISRFSPITILKERT